MKTTKQAKITAAEVITALQSTYPALCEGHGHKLLGITKHGTIDDESRQDKADMLMMQWEEEEAPKKKKGLFG